MENGIGKQASTGLYPAGSFPAVRELESAQRVEMVPVNKIVTGSASVLTKKTGGP